MSGVRITNNMLVSHFMSNLNRNMAVLDKYQYQQATNRRIVNISDDPVGVIKSINARQRIAALEQFQKNVNTSEGWLTCVETALDKMSESMKDMYEKMVDCVNGIKTDEDVSVFSTYAKQMRDNIFNLMNTTYGNQYIFGGFNTTTPPFATVDNNGTNELFYHGLNLTQDGDYGSADYNTSKNEVMNFIVGNQLTMDVSFSGINLLEYKSPESPSSNMYNMLDQLYRDLDMVGSGNYSGDVHELLSPYIKELQDAHAHIVKNMTDVGGRVLRLEMIDEQYKDDYINLMQMKSDIEDNDEAEVIMNAKIAEAAYRAALSSGADIIQPTLLDFLRR